MKRAARSRFHWAPELTGVRRFRIAVSGFLVAATVALSALVLFPFNEAHAGTEKRSAPIPTNALIARAERGDPRAQTRLGFLYQIGRGVPQNYAEAARWQLRAALQGEPRAQYLVGLLYNRGHGVPQDDIQAYMWLSVATARANGSWASTGRRLRDAVSTKLSPMALTKAQDMAAAFHPVPERQ